MPSADFCPRVRMNYFTLSPACVTCSRSPEVSSTAFNAQPPDLQPVPLMDMDFAILGPLVRHRMPHIWFLSIGSHLCSTLLSDPASRRRPCASLSLLLHQDGKRTSTSKLSNMLGTPRKKPERQAPAIGPKGGLRCETQKFSLRRIKPANPSTPEPNNTRLPGSGTGATWPDDR